MLDRTSVVCLAERGAIRKFTSLLQALGYQVDLLEEMENCNVVIDFGAVGDNISSESLTKLLKLHQMTAQIGRKFVLCNMEPGTEDIFSATGLAGVFELSENRFDALATLEMLG